MIRRQVSVGVLALVLSFACTGVSAVQAQPAPSPSYRAAANWLFDLYAGQSVRLSVANALRQRPPGTESVLAPTLPVMVTALERHRETFVAAIMTPLQSHFDATGIASLVTATQVSPPVLDEAQRAKLFEVDAEFRREHQTVIRAMTLDIGLMIASTLSEQGQLRP